MRKLLLPFVLSVVLIACRAPTPEELATQTAAETETFWKDMVATARVTNTMKVRDDMFASIEGLQRYAPSSRPTIPDSSSTMQTFTDMKVYSTRIFTEANVIERSGTMIVFRITGNDLCTPLTGGSTSGSCVSDIEKANMSLRAVGGTRGVVLTLLLNRKIELVTVTFLKGLSISATVDLGNARAASEFMNTTFGTNSPFRNLTFEGSGQVEVGVTKLGELDFETKVSFLTDLAGTVTDDRGFSRSGSSPARSPVFSARIDGQRKVLSADLDVGTSEYRGKWSDFFDYNDNTPMVWALSGLTFKASAADDGPRVVKGISTGPGVSALQYGGAVVGSFELNSALGRAFDIDITPGSGGLSAFSAEPGIAASLAFNLQSLPNPSRFEPALLNQSYLYELKASPQIELVRASQNFDGAMKLTRGSISLSSPTGGSARLFNSVACLNFRSGPLQAGQNPLLDVLNVIACP